LRKFFNFFKKPQKNRLFLKFSKNIYLMLLWVVFLVKSSKLIPFCAFWKKIKLLSRNFLSTNEAIMKISTKTKLMRKHREKYLMRKHEENWFFWEINAETYGKYLMRKHEENWFFQEINPETCGSCISPMITLL
jgi:hypothetical protein